MKRRTKIVLRIYLIGFVLAECLMLRTGQVLGAYERMHGIGDFVLWFAGNSVISAAWPFLVIMIVLQLMGIAI